MKCSFIYLLSIISVTISAQKNDSLVGNFYTKNNKDYSILKNTVSKKYFLREQNGKTRLTNFNYISNLNNRYLQCLDSSNKLIYLDIDYNLKRVSKPKITNWVCGALGEDDYIFKITKNKNKYLISEKLISYSKNTETIKNIDSVYLDGISNIYFLNKKRILQGQSEPAHIGIFNLPSTTILIEKNNQIGILKDGFVGFYDLVETKNNVIKVKQSNNYWFINSKKNKKYKYLEFFTFNLAKFTNEEEENGFLDPFGNEYLD